MIRRSLKTFVAANRGVSRWQKSLAFRWFGRRNGGGDFRKNILPSLLKDNLRVLDVGGGKHPAISVELKEKLGLEIVGLDIEAAELQAAPAGAYDEMVVGDVASTPIPGTFDLIFSKAVLEHTQENHRVLANLASALKAGGKMAHFIPCRNALFARLNLLLGNERARKILFALQPGKTTTSGFKAYYDHCTPTRMSRLCTDNGLQIDQLNAYFSSDYCSFFAPLYSLDMLRQLTTQMLRQRDLAESFVIVASKPTPTVTADDADNEATFEGNGSPSKENVLQPETSSTPGSSAS